MSTAWKYTNNLGGSYGAIIPNAGSTITQTSHVLNSGYIYGASGTAIMLAYFQSPETANLTDFWIKISGSTGTGSTDGNLNWGVREGLNGAGIPGTGIVSSGLIPVTGGLGWMRISGLSVGLTAGKQYCLIISDTDGNGTNFTRIVSRVGSASNSNIAIAAEIGFTANGFSTAYTTTAGCPACAIKIGNDLIGGNMYDALNTTTNGIYARGSRFQPYDNCTLFGAACIADSNIFYAGWTINLYADGINPSGSTLMSWTMPVTNGSISGPQIERIIFPSGKRYDLSGGSWYRLVAIPPSNSTVPRKLTATGSPGTTLISAIMPLGGKCHWTESSGDTWVDDTTSMSQFAPILLPNTDSGSGSSSSFNRFNRVRM